MQFFHNATKWHFSKFAARRIASVMTFSVASLVATSACAMDLSISAGGSSTASQIWTPTVSLDIAGERRPLAGIAWQPVASLGVIGARDERADLDHAVVIAGAGVKLVDWWRQAFFSFQLGYANRETAAVSSNGQFISSLGWEGERTIWTLRHISNGNVYGGKNLGETMLLFGLRL